MDGSKPMSAETMHAIKQILIFMSDRVEPKSLRMAELGKIEGFDAAIEMAQIVGYANSVRDLAEVCNAMLVRSTGVTIN